MNNNDFSSHITKELSRIRGGPVKLVDFLQQCDKEVTVSVLARNILVV